MTIANTQTPDSEGAPYREDGESLDHGQATSRQRIATLPGQVKPPVAVRRLMRPPLTGDRMRTATGLDLLAELARVSSLRAGLQERLEDTDTQLQAAFVERWSA